LDPALGARSIEERHLKTKNSIGELNHLLFSREIQSSLYFQQTIFEFLLSMNYRGLPKKASLGFSGFQGASVVDGK
jgi:hypothetical protein